MLIKPVLLCILDGWGHRNENPPGDDDAIARANTPHWDKIRTSYPMSLLKTSGLAVGLPEGQMGNSEVGHMNIGSGRVVMQDLPRIDTAINDGSLAENIALTAMLAELKDTGKNLHLMGLCSDGGVHGHVRHIIHLAQTAAEAGVKTMLHIFLDGRDVPPGTGPSFLRQIEDALDKSMVTIATISGRYYAMDRDNRWDRVEKAYNAIVSADAPKTAKAIQGVESFIEAGEGDEFIQPFVVEGYTGMEDGDALLMANFRADRAREILEALVNPEFDGFARAHAVTFSHALGMVSYSDRHNAWMTTLFPSISLQNVLGHVLADHGKKQLRISETEKYAHVTFFFNGGEESPFEGEERVLVPSPNVATYDLQPEMSSAEVTEKLVDAIKSDTYDLIIVNYANTDMVGHSGNQGAAQKAVEAVDIALGKLESAITKAGGVMCITADHGNAEQMRDDEGRPHTQHTLNPVPFIVVSKEDYPVKDGALCDIAPTLLAFLHIPQPKEMTGTPLVL